MNFKSSTILIDESNIGELAPLPASFNLFYTISYQILFSISSHFFTWYRLFCAGWVQYFKIIPNLIKLILKMYEAFIEADISVRQEFHKLMGLNISPSGQTKLVAYGKHSAEWISIFKYVISTTALQIFQAPKNI